MKDFQTVVMGTMSVGVFLGIFIIAFITAIGVVLHRAVKKADEAKCTPDTFNKIFFFKDNIVKWTLQILTIGLMIRLSSVALTDEAMFPTAFGIGILSGKFSIWTQGKQNKARE